MFTIFFQLPPRVVASALLLSMGLLLGCSTDVKSLAGKEFVTYDHKEILRFRSDNKVEVAESGRILEGDYTVEEDDRVRIVVSAMGQNMVAYATTNSDGGLMLDYGGNRSRYFLADDPNLAAANRSIETYYETKARVCPDGMCFFGAPDRMYAIRITNAYLEGVGSRPIAFADIKQIEAFTPKGQHSRNKVVRIQADNNSLSGGWREVWFTTEANRNKFYSELAEAVTGWHSRFGIKEFQADPLPQDTRQSDTGSEPAGHTEKSRPALGALQRQLVGSWYAPKEKTGVEFFADGRAVIMGGRSEREMQFTYDLQQNNAIVLMPQTSASSNNRPLTVAVTSIDGNHMDLKMDDGEIVRFFPARFSTNPAKSARTQEQQESLETVIAGISMSGPTKVAIVEYFATNGRFPTNNDEAGISSLTANDRGIEAVEVVADGLVQVRFGDNASGNLPGHSIYLRASVDNDGVVNWECTSEPAIVEDVPGYCTTTFGGSGRRTIDDQTSVATVRSTSTVASTSSSETDSAPATMSEDVRQDSLPPIVHDVAPEHPDRARSRGIEGYAVVMFDIGESGRPRNARVVEASSAMFARPALEALMQRRYAKTGKVTKSARDRFEFRVD